MGINRGPAEAARELAREKPEFYSGQAGSAAAIVDGEIIAALEAMVEIAWPVYLGSEPLGRWEFDFLVAVARAGQPALPPAPAFIVNMAAVREFLEAEQIKQAAAMARWGRLLERLFIDREFHVSPGGVAEVKDRRPGKRVPVKIRRPFCG